MAPEPRAALETFVAALQHHLDAVSTRSSENDTTVLAAYQELAEAFEAYDEAIYTAYDEVTPLVIYEDLDFDSEGFDEDDDDDDRVVDISVNSSEPR